MKIRKIAKWRDTLAAVLILLGILLFVVVFFIAIFGYDKSFIGSVFIASIVSILFFVIAEVLSPA